MLSSWPCTIASRTALTSRYAHGTATFTRIRDGRTRRRGVRALHRADRPGRPATRQPVRRATPERCVRRQSLGTSAHVVQRAPCGGEGVTRLLDRVCDGITRAAGLDCICRERPCVLPAAAAAARTRPAALRAPRAARGTARGAPRSRDTGNVGAVRDVEEPLPARAHVAAAHVVAHHERLDEVGVRGIGILVSWRHRSFRRVRADRILPGPTG
jgi:hypothetical protein